MTEQDLINGGLDRVDSENLEVQCWWNESTGQEYIYRTSNGNLYEMPMGFLTYNDALVEIQQWLIIRQIINLMSITKNQKDALLNAIPTRSLVGPKVTRL